MTFILYNEHMELHNFTVFHHVEKNIVTFIGYNDKTERAASRHYINLHGAGSFFVICSIEKDFIWSRFMI